MRSANANQAAGWRSYHHREVHGAHWAAYGDSVPGPVRTRNEDNFTLFPLADGALVAAVADGLGGHPAGDLASRLACESVFANLWPGAPDFDLADTELISRKLETVVQAAHLSVRQRSERVPRASGMGCTLTLALLVSGRVHYTQIGDSRLYHFAEGRCTQLTRDQKASTAGAGNLQATATAGLTQALGMELEAEPLVAQHGSVALNPGENLLLCSDGLSDALSEEQILACVLTKGSIIRRVHTLIELALRRGSSDNVTAVLVAISSG